MCVDEATLYAELIERIAKAEYSKKYKALVSEQKSDGTVAIVAIIAASKLEKPANAPASWPRMKELKELATVLKIKVDKAAKRATLLAAIHSYWLALPAARKDALCSPGAASHARQPRLQPTAAPAAAASPTVAAAAPPPAAGPAPANPVALAVAHMVARSQAAAVAAAQQAAHDEDAAAEAEAGVEVQAAAEAEAEAGAEAEAPEAETELQVAVEAAALEEEEEEAEVAEVAEAQAEQAAAASLVDSLELVDLKDCMACSRACGERFSHLTMTTKAKGFKGQFVCMDREACLQRQLSGGGAMERARKAARR